ncbi:Protein of unknown function [Pyronema omphalodes CBS 100304]|uniref:Uncharacterized protein n=1 Tax=Pyronema omphalodes (strain CBS 100304) TaxID=1076935 RepID=U4LQP4_PYROM|nr:Protein of unknown function [Pyronema omphalodes CBS 100304]
MVECSVVWRFESGNLRCNALQWCFLPSHPEGGRLATFPWETSICSFHFISDFNRDLADVSGEGGSYVSRYTKKYLEPDEKA